MRMSHSDSELESEFFVVDPMVLRRRRRRQALDKIAASNVSHVATVSAPSISKAKLRSNFTRQYLRHYSRLDLERQHRDQQFMDAICTNNTERVEWALRQRGCNVNYVDAEGRSVLHIATNKGYTDVVRVLLSYGADPNIRDRRLNTPLHLAACAHNSEVIEELLKAGADAAALDVHGKNPLQLAESKLRVLRRNCLMQTNKNNESATQLLADVKRIIDVIKTYARYTQMTGIHLDFNRLNLNALDTNSDLDGTMAELLHQMQQIQFT